MTKPTKVGALPLYNLSAKTSTIVVLAAAATVVTPWPAYAADLEEVIGNLTPNIDALFDLIPLLSVVAGVGLAAMCVMKLKAARDNPAQESPMNGVVYLALAGLGIAIPEVLDVGVGTFFNNDANTGPSGGILDNLRYEE